MTAYRRIWALRTLVAVTGLGVLLWVFSGSAADLQNLAPPGTVWFVDVPDLPCFLDEVSTSPMARRLENEPAWKSLLEEPGLREILRRFHEQWPKWRDTLDRRCALAGVLDGNGATVDVLLLCRLKRGAAIAGTVEQLLQDPSTRQRAPVPYALIGRVLAVSKSEKLIQRVMAHHDSSERSDSAVAQAFRRLPHPEERPLLYLNSETLMAHPGILPGFSVELWWLAPLASESKEIVMTLAVGADLSWSGLAVLKSSPMASASQKKWTFLPGGPAVQTVRMVDFPALWEAMLGQTDAETRRAIQGEIIDLDKTVMENKSFVHEFLPRLGPVWEMNVVPLDPSRFSAAPKYLLPVVQAGVQVRDRWASRKIRDMVVAMVDRITRSRDKQKQPMPFALEEESQRDVTYIRFKLIGEEAHRLGEAFAPGLVLTPDAAVLTSYLPYTRSEMSSSGRGSIESRGEISSHFSLNGLATERLVRDLKDAVVDTIVNDHFRRQAEPDADKRMAERAAQGEFEQAARRIREQVMRDGQIASGKKEREAQRLLSKYIYEEKLRLIEERMSQSVRTPDYAKDRVGVSDRVEQWIRRLGLIDELDLTTRPEGDSMSLQGNLRLRRGP